MYTLYIKTIHTDYGDTCECCGEYTESYHRTQRPVLASRR